MGLSSINYQPKMTRFLVNHRVFDGHKFVVVDAGARRGGQRLWDAYGDQFTLYGFEPDEEECNNLNEKLSVKGHYYFPVALHKNKAKRTFYITENSSSCGFYKNNMTYWSRFPDKVNLRVLKTVQMETVDFDSFAKSNGIEYVDFIKLDTEGAELDVLEGSVNYLRKGTVLGANIEVRFSNVARQPVFSEIDSFMRQMGFQLFDLVVYRHAREVLSEFSSNAKPGSTKGGQVIWGQALYFRDGVAELDAGGTESNWSDNSILKLASLFEIFGLPDCAIELVEAAGRNDHLKNSDIPYLMDLLTPPFNGKEITYHEYQEILEAGKFEKEDSLKNMLWKDLRLVASHYLPDPVKSLIKKTILRGYNAG